MYGEKSHLFAYLRFCAFAWVSLCLLVFIVIFVLLVLLVLFVRAKSFRKNNNNNKKFKTALITSSILLLNLYYYKLEFFNYNPFQLSQSFSIIMIFFNYYDLFDYNLFYYNLFESLLLVTLSL